MQSSACLPSRVRRVGRRPSIVAACALAALGACNSVKSPPSLPAIPAPPVALPKPTAPADPTMFGYLLVRDPVALLRQAGGPLGEQLAAQRGLNLTELTSGAPLAAFVWDPQGATANDAPVVVLAPAPASGGLIGMVKTAVPNVQAVPVGPGQALTALSVGAAAGERVKSDGDALLSLAQAQSPFDITLFVNATPILAKYGPILRNAIKGLEPILTMAQSRPGGAAGLGPKSTMAMFDQMVNGLEDVQSYTLGASLTRTALELSSITAQKSGDDGGPISAPDLTQFLPPGDLKMQWNIRDLKKAVDWYMRFYGGILDERPELRAQVLPLINDWLKAGRHMETALSIAYRGGQGGLTLHGILRVEDGPAALAALRKSSKLLESGTVRDFYKSVGIDFTIRHTQVVRKVKGNPVDRFEWSLKATNDNSLDPVSRQMFDKMSGITYEIAQAGPYLIYALGVPVESILDPLYAGKGAHPLPAMHAFPPGGTLYLELDISRALDWLRALTPANQRDVLPTLPAAGSVVSLWSYDKGPISYQKVVIPRQLLTSIASAAR